MQTLLFYQFQMPQPWMLLEEEESIVYKIGSAKTLTVKVECIYCYWIDKIQMFLVSTWKLETLMLKVCRILTPYAKIRSHI